MRFSVEPGPAGGGICAGARPRWGGGGGGPEEEMRVYRVADTPVDSVCDVLPTDGVREAAAPAARPPAPAREDRSGRTHRRWEGRAPAASRRPPRTRGRSASARG